VVGRGCRVNLVVSDFLLVTVAFRPGYGQLPPNPAALDPPPATYAQGMLRSRSDARSSQLREVAGSWLQGPPRSAAGYPGERLGLPRTGRGSMASFGERLGAVVVDLAISSVIGLLLVRPTRVGQEQLWNLVSVAAFIVMTSVLTLTSGRTLGMRLAHLQIVRLDGGTVGPRAFVRQSLVAVLVPALIWNADQRGLHDRACHTAVVRVR